TLALSSISSSHVFIDKDSNPRSTTSIVRLNSNPEFAKKEVTKAETTTIGKIFAYIKQGLAKANERGTQAITVMKVVSPSVLQPLTSPVGIPLATTSEMPLFSASD
ncbi:hypothetical protein HID58_079412, partial [Brassica napus]